MIKFWLTILIFLFPAFSFSQPLANDSLGKETALLPGTVTSVPFNILNKSMAAHTFDISVTTSSNTIIPIATQQSVNILANDHFVYIVPIRIASNALKGTYKITILLWDKNAGIKFTRVAYIVVAGLQKIKITPIESPEYLKAGERLKTSFLIENNGNTTEKLLLETNAQLVDTTSKIILKPGASQIIFVEKQILNTIAKNDQLSIKLQAVSIANPQQKWLAYSHTLVMATHPTDEDVYFRFPVDISSAYIGMRNKGNYLGGFQGELLGKGSLNNKHSDMLTFHAVTPSPIPLSIFSKYEEYFVSYKRKHLYAHLGDKCYSASYLTENYRYGRGAELHYTFDNITIGGFYNRPRFFNDIREEYNVFSGIKLNKTTQLTAGYLFKTPKEEKDNHSFYQLQEKTQLPYVVAETKLFKDKLNLLAEGAYSHSFSENGYAWRLQSSGYFKNFSGNFQYIKAAPHFNGYFKNTTSINGYLSYRFLNKLRLSANYNQDARNEQRDTLFLSAPYRKTYQLGLDYQYIKTGHLTLYAGNRQYEDRMEQKQFDYKEKFLRLNIHQDIAYFKLNVESEWGKTTNYLTGFSGNGQYYTVNLGVEKFNTSFNLYGSYAKTSRYLQNNQELYYYGARLLSRFSKNSFLSLFYQNSYQPEDYYQNRNLFEIKYHQQTFRHQDIEFSGRYALQQGSLDKKDYIFSLKYTVHINLPIQKTAEYTTLAGHIKNRGVQNIKGIRIRLGNHITETDALGKYVFKNIVPGDYYLYIDRENLPLNDISTVAMPQLLHLTKEGNVFDVGLTTAASISGKVVLKKEEENDVAQQLVAAIKNNNATSHIIIEASNGSQSYRKICSLNAAFDFTYLRPGHWTIKVYRNGLDKNYKVLEDTFNFELKPGATQNVQIQVVKKQTKIKFQQGSINVSYSH